MKVEAGDISASVVEWDDTPEEPLDHGPDAVAHEDHCSGLCDAAAGTGGGASRGC